MPNPLPLPIHFKLPGRSYSQIGRKGNVALYSVYSDYVNNRACSLPYILIGFELIVIKIKDGYETYPSAWQFGKSAWSIPKSFSRVCSAGARRCVCVLAKLRRLSFDSIPYRSTSTQESAHLAWRTEPIGETSSEQATYTPQRRVTLLKGQL